MALFPPPPSDMTNRPVVSGHHAQPTAGGFLGQGRWRWLVYVSAPVAAVWVVLYIWRVHANQPNVDD